MDFVSEFYSKDLSRNICCLHEHNLALQLLLIFMGADTSTSTNTSEKIPIINHTLFLLETDQIVFVITLTLWFWYNDTYGSETKRQMMLNETFGKNF